MNSELIAISVSAFFGASSLCLSVYCYVKQRRCRQLLEFTEKQIEDLEISLSKNKEVFDASSQRAAEQARRIAWLETRVRQPKAQDEETVADSPTDVTKLSMTERRHRVIALASRGQNAEAIAGILGLMPGEVELIISMSQAVKG